MIRDLILLRQFFLTPYYVEQAIEDANESCGLKKASWLWTTSCTENSWEERPTSTDACRVELFREYHDFHSQKRTLFARGKIPWEI